MADVRFFNHGTLDEIASLAFPVTAAGATSATQIVDLWYRKDGISGGLLTEGRVAVSVGGLLSGVPALDEHWLQGRINGGLNPGNDPTFIADASDWTGIGSASFLDFSAMPANTCRFAEFQVAPPLVAGLITEDLIAKLLVRANDVTEPAGAGVADEGSGIFTGVGDLRVTEWVTPPTVVATGVGSVDIGAGGPALAVFRGVESTRDATDTLTLDQDDGAAATLASGEAYAALISQPPGDVARVATKGVKALAGATVTPGLPVGHLRHSVVQVLYGAGGSVIVTGDVTVLATSGRGIPSASAASPVVTLAPFRAIVGASRVRRETETLIVHPLSATRYSWCLASSAFVLTETNDPPVAGAVPWTLAVLDGTGVTSLTDLRIFRPTGPTGAVGVDGAPGTAFTREAPSGTIDGSGSNFTFTLANALGPHDIVYVDGVPNWGASAVSLTLTVTVAPFTDIWVVHA
jgi:hypothetical protein